ncbi:MAG: arsenite methyltransferase [Candidatus Bathyarchaeota archaeon]|nr:arsenite methyltransferase [Candidatus Bathyarchaeota archaeon]
MKDDDIRRKVREGYSKIARTKECGCCGSEISEEIGYSRAELESVPLGADMNLGCGNPVALASLKEGEIVIDLGSGGGLDCFLTAKKVGSNGRVIGVDMTPEMLDKARANCRRGGYENVEFRLGEIENLPVADSTADVIISNCVINLSPEKQRVFNEVFRVLKPGGRLMISDIVLLKDIPEAVKSNVLAYVGCISGAEMKSTYIKMIEEAGFNEIEVVEETKLEPEQILSDATASSIMEELNINREQAGEIVGSVVSLRISANKP